MSQKDFAKIKCTIWGSRKYKTLSDEHKLFYLYLHTNTRVNSCGCYYNPVGYMTVDLKWKEAKVEAALQACIEAKLIRYNEKEDTVLIEGFFSVNSPQNPKHAIKLLSDIESIPYQPFMKDCAQELKRFIENSGWKIEQDFLYRIGVVSALDLDIDVDIDVDNITVGCDEKTQNSVPEKINMPDTFKMPDGTIVDFDMMFERFWQNYPKVRDKGHKGKAKEQLTKLLKKGKSYEEIGRGITKYRRYCEGTGEKNSDMFRWLRDECYERDYAISATASPGHGRSSGNSIEASVDQALSDTTRRPDKHQERLKGLGLDDD